VAELLERRRLTLRDRLDAAAVFDGLTAADLDWLTGLAADARLEAELRLAREAARPGIAGDRAPSGPGGLTGLTRRVAPSASRAVRHVLSATAGRHRPLALRAAAVSAVRDWAIDRLDEHPTSRLHAVPAAWLNDLLTPFVVGPGACAFMIPLNETDRGPFTLDRDGSQWIARTPVGSFLAAALPTVSPSRLEAARSASPVPSRNEQR
jgi:hypothetical protein